MDWPRRLHAIHAIIVYENSSKAHVGYTPFGPAPHDQPMADHELEDVDILEDEPQSYEELRDRRREKRMRRLLASCCFLAFLAMTVLAGVLLANKIIRDGSAAHRSIFGTNMTKTAGAESPAYTQATTQIDSIETAGTHSSVLLSQPPENLATGSLPAPPQEREADANPQDTGLEATDAQAANTPRKLHRYAAGSLRDIEASLQHVDKRENQLVPLIEYESKGAIVTARVSHVHVKPFSNDLGPRYFADGEVATATHSSHPLGPILHNANELAEALFGHNKRQEVHTDFETRIAPYSTDADGIIYYQTTVEPVYHTHPEGGLMPIAPVINPTMINGDRQPSMAPPATSPNGMATPASVTAVPTSAISSVTTSATQSQSPMPEGGPE
ncbi:hypothetical protein Dda_3703 [Drechslerella dactyloides]|uniref:Uncharacterized protein n=1 Tax=Drechslerella dactyloides TaxID=74499 RepID=A0AAD6NLE2_DREDA|nr:hypothetical protein Dda_3703 [Drechslerella dactyloides]